jgi:hypothetical protein
VLSLYCQAQKKVAVERLNYFDEEDNAWCEILVEDKRTNPAELAASPGSLREKAVAVAGLDRRGEAARFAREALWLCQHRQLDQALRAIEVAVALAPRDAAVLDRAMQVFFFAASETIDPGRSALPARPLPVSLKTFGESLSHAERGMTAAEGLFCGEGMGQSPGVAAAADKGDGPGGGPAFLPGLASLKRCFQRLLLVEDEQTEQTRARLASLQRRYRAVCKAAHARASRAVRDRQTFRCYTEWWSFLLGNVHLYAPTGRLWADDTAEWIAAWLEAAARHGVYWDDLGTLNRTFTATATRTAQGDGAEPAGQWMLANDDLKQLSDAYGKMTRRPEPAIAVLGHANRLILFLSMRRPVAAEAVWPFREFLARAQAVICDPAPGDPVATRAICYYAILDAIEALPAEADRRRHFEELLEFMLTRRELVRGVVAAACEPVHAAYGHYTTGGEHAFGRRATTAVPLSEYDRLAAARRVLAGIAAGELVSLDGPAAAAQFRVIAAREKLFLARPELRPKTPAPWSRARRLLCVAQAPGLRAISRVLIRGETAWTVGIGNDDEDPQGYWQLMAVDLDGGACRRWPRVRHARGPVPPRTPPYSDNCHLEIDGTTAYVGSFYCGICVLPLDGGGPTWLQRRNHADPARQLPSDRVFSLASLGGKLYASLGAFSGQGTFLVSIDLADRSVRTLSSSRGSVGQAPLDDRQQPPLVFLPMLKDPARHRVLFVVSQPLADAGLWEIDVRTDRIRRLTAHDRPVHWVSDVRGDRVTLALAGPGGTEWEAIEYDLGRDASRRVFLGGGRPADSSGLPQDAWVTPDWLAQPPYLRVGRWWWTGWPFGRIPRGARSGEPLPFLEDRPELLQELVGLDHEYNWRQIEPLSGSRILWCDRHGVWLLDLPAEGDPNLR